MKRVIIVSLVLSIAFNGVFAQNYKNIDSLKTVIKKTPKPDTKTVNLYRLIVINYIYSKPDSALYYNSLAKKIAKDLHYQTGLFRINLTDALCYSLQRKDSLALQLALTCLKEAETDSDNGEKLKRAYAYLGSISFHIRDFESAIKYNRKFYSLLSTSKADSGLLATYYEHMGEMYDQMNELDSAESYITKSFQLYSKLGRLRDFSYYLMGNIYAKRNQFNLALQFYREAKSASVLNRITGEGLKNKMDIEIGFARVFKQLNQIDSAIAHAKEAYRISTDITIPREKLESLTLLTELYKQKGNVDSAYLYLNNLSVLKDTLVSEEKIKAIQSLSFSEENRQEKLNEEKEKEQEERNHNIQLASIAIGILTIAIIFLLLSNSIIVSHKVVEFLSVLVLLVVFEFINLLIHPFLESITQHSPVLMLMGLVCIAALIIPLHHRLEHWATHKLVEKNKAIRLAKAKKTIEELEEKEEDNNLETL